ncbi:MAG: glucose-6-phosphate isomerase, partial [Cyanobacteriota bacterium]|nr:glucose-6-phosphate isomerase [Cyanobacteriota bacterium]
MPLAADPFVASPEQQWQRFCELLWFDDDLGFWLDVSRMALGPADLDQLRPRFAAAFEAMARLESGAIANADEQRMVGHYWLRDPQLAPDATVAQHISSEIDRIEGFAQNVL